MKGSVKRTWRFSMVSAIILSLVLASGCLSQPQTLDPAIEPVDGSSEGVNSFSAYKNGSLVKVQVIFSDRKVHSGSASFIVEDKDGNVLYREERSLFPADFIDTAICTQEFCGIEKTYELSLPLEIEGTGYKAVLLFVEGNGGVYNARTEIEIYGF